MKNKITDLTDHLFAQLERLSDEDLKGDGLKEEIERSRAITGVAASITSAARLAVDAATLQIDYPTLGKHLSLLTNE